MASDLAASNPALVKMLGLAEYILPGFGLESSADPSPYWTLYSNWQLAFFSIPDAAEYFISGKEREMLVWYFFHTSYSGPTAFPEDIINRYYTQISKPGFLRALFGPFSSAANAADDSFFTGTLGKSPLEMPVLGMGGEASLGIPSFIHEAFGPIAKNLSVAVVPKAGHWIGES